MKNEAENNEIIEMSDDEALKLLMEAKRPEDEFLIYRKASLTSPEIKLKVRIQGLYGKEIDRLKEICTHRRKIKGGRSEEVFDDDEFMAQVISTATISPKFGDEKLLKHYEASSAAEVIKRMLLAGEREDLADKILELSGFGVDIEEVKN